MSTVAEGGGGIAERVIALKPKPTATPQKNGDPCTTFIGNLSGILVPDPPPYSGQMCQFINLPAAAAITPAPQPIPQTPKAPLRSSAPPIKKPIKTPSKVLSKRARTPKKAKKLKKPKKAARRKSSQQPKKGRKKGGKK
jgi:hypothetical protein